MILLISIHLQIVISKPHPNKITGLSEPIGNFHLNQPIENFFNILLHIFFVHRFCITFSTLVKKLLYCFKLMYLMHLKV